LDGQTLGVVGFGAIGSAVARIGRAFGMNVLVYSVPEPGALPEGMSTSGLTGLFADSDIVTLHCPLTEETQDLVDERTLRTMKPTALLINTGRGELIDEGALAAALDRGEIAGAGLDVLRAEPPPEDHPLIGAANCIVTPHMAWASRASRQRLLDTACENVRAFLEGRAANVVGGVKEVGRRP
jgi:glycerate dehydrogenase